MLEPEADVPDDEAPIALNRSSRNVCSALSASVVVLPVLAVPVLLAVVAAGVLLEELLVTVVLGVEVVVVVVDAAAVELLAALLPVVAPRLWPNAWNTASMKALKLLAVLPAPRAAVLPSSSPSLSCDWAGAAAVDWTELVLFAPEAVNQLILLLPYALMFIAVPFSRCTATGALRTGTVSGRPTGCGQEFARQLRYGCPLARLSGWGWSFVTERNTVGKLQAIGAIGRPSLPAAR